MNEKHAYLIMAHEDFYILEKLILLLDNEHNDLYIHIDKKVKKFDFEFFKSLPQKSNIYFIDRIKVYWGDFSQIECHLKLLESAIKNNYEYYHLISGTDLPIKSSEEIYQYFHTNKYEYVTFNNVYCKDRVQYYYLKFKKRDKFHYFLNDIFVDIQELVGVNRVKNANIEFKNGLEWYSISNDLAKYVLDNKSMIHTYFEKGICTDEMYVQTLTWNSDFKNNIYNYKKSDPETSFRLIDWNRGKPYTFDIDDYDLIMNSKCFFARKFSSKTEKQKELVNKVFNKLKK